MTSCKDYVKIQKYAMKDYLKSVTELTGTAPRLVVIQIGNNPASNSYIKGKKSDCEEVGINITHCHIDNYDKYEQKDVEDIIKSYNENCAVDGIIIQLPIPDKYNIEALQQCISPSKDVDGFRRDSLFKSCTPKGIMDWLEYNKVDLVGKNVVVLGRSEIVGKPLVNMMIEAGATVTCCNSKTRSVKHFTHDADIVVSAIGKPKHWDFSYFANDTLIIDVGINRDGNRKLCGDVDDTYFEKYIPNTYVTPVPGGVGLLTRIALLQNVIDSYNRYYELN